MNTRQAIDRSSGPVALSAAFNQNSTCFCVGLDSGFCGKECMLGVLRVLIEYQAVFSSDPCQLQKSREFNAGIGVAEMLGRSNYVALVGGGKQPKFPQNKVGTHTGPSRFQESQPKYSDAGRDLG
ncbi:MAG: Phosphatidylinositol 3,5-bisphosphate-binding protein [Piccolia ochrophora]|nr:MAG: Phosphatidylinositol 3,5-bisphosphate-binding protein [Piccolia ochrophora]